MKIATKFRLNSIFSFCIIILVSSLFFFTYQQTKNALAVNRIAHKVTQEVIEINRMTAAYLYDSSENSRMLWMSGHDSLSERIRELKKMFAGPDISGKERHLLYSIEHSNNKLHFIFSQLSSISTKQKDTEPEDLKLIRLRKLLADNLLLKANKLSQDVEKLNELILGNMFNNNRMIGMFALVSISIFTLMILAYSFFGSKNVTTPIDKLSRGTRVIGEGNLDHHIDIDSDDEVGELSGAFNKMTENLKTIMVARDELIKEIEKFKFISDNANNAHFLVDRDAKFHYVNQTSCRMLGYSEDELLKLGVPDVDIEYGLERYQALFELIQKEAVPPVETVNRRKDGTTFPSEITVTGYQIEGKPYMFAVLRDITERRINEKALQNAKEDIEAWNRELEKRVKEKTEELERSQAQLIQSEKLSAMGHMAGGLAHELNSPLAGLLPMLEHYRNNAEKDSREYKEFSLMYKASEYMAKIVRDFGSFSRESKGEYTKLDLNEVIDDTVGFSASRIKQKSIQMIREYEDALPGIMGERTELQQVILNIITNALDAMPDRGTFMIKTGISKDDHVMMEFSDNGTGIEKENLDKIFDPFFTTKRPGKGTGLGLSVSYKIIEKHGGNISVESEPGKGTKFTILLPAVTAHS